MNLPIEYASGERVSSRTSPFPASWGAPPIDATARAAWIAVHTRGLPLLPGVEIRASRTIDPRQALLALSAKSQAIA